MTCPRVDLARFRGCWAPDVMLAAGLLMGAAWLMAQSGSRSQGRSEPDRLEGHSSAVTSLAFSSDGNDLVSGSWDGTVRIWDVGAKTQRRIATRDSATIFFLAHSADGQLFAGGSDDGHLRVWDTSGNRRVDVHAVRSGPIRALTISPDRKTLASKERKTLASTGQYTTVQLWDIATGSVLVELCGHTDVVTAAVFTPDGTTVITSSLDGTIRLWDAATGRQTGLLVDLSSSAGSRTAARPGAILGLAITPDGKALAACGYDARIIRLWNLATRAELTALRGHTAGIRSLAFSPDGRYLASAGGDHTVRLWDWRSGRTIASSPGHVGWVKALAYSPDGTRVAAGGDDGTIRLWDVSGLRPPGTSTTDGKGTLDHGAEEDSTTETQRHREEKEREEG